MSIHHEHYPDRTGDTAGETAAGVGGAVIGLFLAAMLVIGLLLALFMWSPWNVGVITPQPGTGQPGDLDINIRGDIRVPQSPSGDMGSGDTGGGQQQPSSP